MRTAAHLEGAERMKTSLVGAVSLLLCTMLLGCGGSPSSPSAAAANLSGTWAGPLTSTLVGNGTVQVTLNQSGSSLSGTWLSTFPDPSNNNSGSLSGTVNGSNVSATLTPSDPTNCPLNVTATVNGNVMTGTYAAFNCTVAVVRGSLRPTKQ